VRRCFDPIGAWPPHRATRIDGSLRLAGFSASVPCTALVWPGEQSYTRAPTVELHLVGSPPIVEAAAAALCAAGARPARPGEFTMRAFLAGRIDLVEAEGVLGVVEADDRRRLDEALRQMAGGLSRRLDELRDELVDLAAHLEAGLDFVDEDIEFISRTDLISGIAAAEASVAELLERMDTRSEAADYVRVVLVGPPNAGKSSLFNALVGGERALVSPAAGTTRDYLTARLRFGGVPCELIDTAGVAGTSRRPQSDGVAAAAERATAERAAAAHVQLLCNDGSAAESELPDFVLAGTATRIVVRTKADLAAKLPTDQPAVSALSGQGLAALRDRVARAAEEIIAGTGDVVASTAVRCRDSLVRARTALADAREAAGGRGDELVAAALRAALDELGQVVGAVYTDDILDRVFSRFCIGK
jgi:tRNA modification GTPase